MVKGAISPLIDDYLCVWCAAVDFRGTEQPKKRNGHDKAPSFVNQSNVWALMYCGHLLRNSSGMPFP